MAIELYAHNEQTYQNMVSMFETRNRVVAVHAGGMPMRKPSLASMVQSADARQKAQAAAREYTPGIQHKPEGR